MLVIGLTGGIGSGKSTVATLFAKHHVTIIDTDQIARDLTIPGQPALQEIVNHFGQKILQKDGSLNRSYLRQIIFNKNNEKHWLENLLHPLIRLAVKKQIESSDSSYCIVVIPLLFETAPNPLIDRVLVVDAPEELQVDRAKKRDHTSDNEIQTILKTQVTRLQRLTLADDIIKNDKTINELSSKVDKLHELYLQLAKT